MLGGRVSGRSRRWRRKPLGFRSPTGLSGATTRGQGVLLLRSRDCRLLNLFKPFESRKGLGGLLPCDDSLRFDVS